MQRVKLCLQGGIDQIGVPHPFGIGFAQRSAGIGQLRIGAAHPLDFQIKLFGLGLCRGRTVVARLCCGQLSPQMGGFIFQPLFQGSDLFRKLCVDSALLRQFFRKIGDLRLGDGQFVSSARCPFKRRQNTALQVFYVAHRRVCTVDLNALAKAHPAHWSKATAIRALTLDAVAAAKSGHSGMPMGMADVATVLFEKHLKFDASNPLWPDRDRFILSAGHGSMLIYSLLHLTGYEQFPLEEIKNFRQMGARTAGHPENFLADAIETTTGPLGQGISNAVGFAMAEEMLRARFGKKIVDHHTYVIAGDGCLMEGVSQEAISLAGRHELSKLIVFWDNNNITIDGTVDLADRTDQVARFKASGWDVQEIDGHDPVAIDAAIAKAKKGKRPQMIACKTHIALGHAAQDTSKGHGALTDPDQMAAAKDAYGWTTGPFEVPSDVKSAWEEIGKRGADDRRAWEERFDAMSRTKREEFNRALAGDAPKKLSATIKAFKKQTSENAPKLATGNRWRLG